MSGSRIRRAGTLARVDAALPHAVGQSEIHKGIVDPFARLEETRLRLEFIGTPVLGYVFNRGSPRDGWRSGYSHGGAPF